MRKFAGAFLGPAVLVLTFTFCPAAAAEPTLPHLFSDHMVLQRDAPIHVWGVADAGEAISVALGGRSAQTHADNAGHWSVTLEAMHAGGPFALQIAGKKTLIFRDVMIGEVWVASGQSNMTYALSGSAGSDEEIPRASYPEIRLFTVPQRIAMVPQNDTLDSSWQVCAPDSAKGFSAVAYYFARKLRRELHVPIGIILSAWPGTAGEEWTDPESLRSKPELQPIIGRWDAESAAVKSFAAQGLPLALEFDDFELLPAEGSAAPPKLLSNFDSGEPDTSTGGTWTYSWKESPRSTFELVQPGRGGTGYAARVSGVLDGSSSSRLQGNLSQGPSNTDLSAYAGIRFWLRGNGSVQFQTLQPTIEDWDNYSAPTIEATPEWKQVTIWFRDLKQAGWGVVHPLTLNTLSAFQFVNMTGAGDPNRPPSGLYNAMITPLEPYRIRGAIWYQGEGNTWRAQQYQTLLPALITGWRKGWNEGDFPFLIVQLPNQGTSPELGESIWAEMREAQLLTVKRVPDTGLAVTIDVGEENNLHPPRKAEVGERLALWALGTTYGQHIEYSGPLYQSTQIKGNRVQIRFTHTGTGLEAKGGDELKGFSIAGADKKFHWASAQISGDTVIVSSPDVPAPVAVRYAWANSPPCNLYNHDGLPASPFRTDDWPGASDGKR